MFYLIKGYQGTEELFGGISHTTHDVSYFQILVSRAENCVYSQTVSTTDNIIKLRERQCST